jgi:hypothetical protein
MLKMRSGRTSAATARSRSSRMVVSRLRSIAALEGEAGVDTEPFVKAAETLGREFVHAYAPFTGRRLCFFTHSLRLDAPIRNVAANGALFEACRVATGRNGERRTQLILPVSGCDSNASVRADA